VTKCVPVSRRASLPLPSTSAPTTRIPSPRTSTLLHTLADLRQQEAATEETFGYTAELAIRIQGR
jgi:hypothetical protein